MTRLAAKFARPLFGLFAALVFLAPAGPALGGAPINAHPALWTVYGPKGKAYMLGSIHILPPNIQWKTPEIMKAIAAADTFVFEIPLDHQDQDTHKIQEVQKKVMDQNGMLPPGQSLRGLLPEAMKADYDTALEQLSISPAYVDRLQPWLAALVLENSQFFRSDFQAMLGVDRQIYQIASAAKKSTRGFESLEDQLALITPEEQQAGIAELSEQVGSALKHDGIKKVDAMVAAWARGDTAALNHMSADAFDKDPTLKKGILDNRNRRWVGELRTMLAAPHVYFVTVGAAHLAGPGGVPALMRAAGYRVEGPIDMTVPNARPTPALRLSTDAKPALSLKAKPAPATHRSADAKPSPSLHANATPAAHLSANAKPQPSPHANATPAVHLSAASAKPSPSLHANSTPAVHLSVNVKPSGSRTGEPPSSPRLSQAPSSPLLPLSAKKPSSLRLTRD